MIINQKFRGKSEEDYKWKKDTRGYYSVKDSKT